MNPHFTITNGLAQIERARGFWEAAHLSEAWIRRMSEHALLLEAHHTTHVARDNPYTVQSSNGKPAMRENSAVLCVTKLR